MIGAAVVLIAAASPAGALLEGGSCAPTSVRRVRPMMATFVSVTVVGCDAAALEDHVRAAFAEMQRLAGILSEWEAESAVSQVNAGAGRARVAVPPELAAVLEGAEEVSRLTSGAFDATWAALDGLWQFGEGSRSIPSSGRVRDARALVGHQDLSLEPRGTAFLRRPGMRIGLGGISKGYMAAAAADLLVARGIPDVLVAAGGDIAARGKNGGRPWTIAVRDPRRRSGLLATVELKEESISTAGDYERSFVVGGKRYHHILDPRTGWPARGTRSVTVIAKRGLLADGLDTGLFVLGAHRGRAVAGSIPDVFALFVDEEGRVSFSPGGARRFHLLRAPGDG